MTKPVNIVIPIYKSDLDSDERIALQRCCNVLSAYPKTIVKPKSLNINALLDEFPALSVADFADDYFTDILAYNRLMMSTDFYERFLEYEYILVYQLDAYVFSDELTEWCAKGFDYIGAPWLMKKKYDTVFWQKMIVFKKIWYKIKGKPFRHVFLGNKVGNGGFSLRRVAAHLQIVREKQNQITYYLQQSTQHSEFNEDVFWAMQPDVFTYPTKEEALQFAFDLHPDRCMKYNGGNLPFGCHGWNKKHRRKFWRKYISELA